MAREKQVAAVITEDSDLIVFGAPEIIFKLDSTGCVPRLSPLESCETGGLFTMPIPLFTKLIVVAFVQVGNSDPGKADP
jgi:hypothetical protein